VIWGIPYLLIRVAVAELTPASLVFLRTAIGALLLLPLLIPRLPAKSLNAGLFFAAFPAVAFFLLHGGGLSGFGVSWTASLLSAFADSLNNAGRVLTDAGASTPLVAPLAWLAGKVLVLLGSAVALGISPLVWLRDQVQAAGRPLWIDFAVTAVAVSALLFFLSGGTRAGWRPLIVSLVTFAGIGVVIAAMGLDRGGFPVVDTRLWGGLLVTLVVSVTGIVASMPIGIALALGRYILRFHCRIDDYQLFGADLFVCIVCAFHSSVCTSDCVMG